jgi:hypothetical protein
MHQIAEYERVTKAPTARVIARRSSILSGTADGQAATLGKAAYAHHWHRNRSAVSLALCGQMQTEPAFPLRGVLFRACLAAALLLSG